MNKSLKTLFHQFLQEHHLFTRTDQNLYCHSKKPLSNTQVNIPLASQPENKPRDWEAEIQERFNQGYQAGLRARDELEDQLKRNKK